MLLLKTNEDAKKYQDNPEYTVIESPLDIYVFLAFSKTATDNLPITTTQVSVEPCLDPAGVIDGRDYYPTEIDAKF